LYHGTRSDDPNDIYPHQHRRDLRGLYVFAAWLNHYDATSLNTLDAVVEENGARFVRHHLIDFGSILGSSGVGARDPRNGFVYQYDFNFGWKAALSFGLWAPKWQRADYRELPEAGKFEAEAFDPRHWKPIYPNPAFINRLPDDTYWGAKQVMAFTDEEIRRLAATGEYDDPRAAEHVAAVLIERRNKIGRAFLSAVLPLDNFRVSHGAVVFDDLLARHGFAAPARIAAEWFAYDPRGGRGSRIAGDIVQLPPALEDAPIGRLAVVSLRRAEDDGKRVDVYLRKTGQGAWDVAGISRTW
jgi:hypothetical protein